ncbi:MAG: hypothetical protein IPM94_08110 [bacterium]|nr:hypothetical protein [bacterium]
MQCTYEDREGRIWVGGYRPVPARRQRVRQLDGDIALAVVGTGVPTESPSRHEGRLSSEMTVAVICIGAATSGISLFRHAEQPYPGSQQVIV